MARSIARRTARTLTSCVVCLVTAALLAGSGRLDAQVREATEALDRTTAAAEASLKLGELQIAESLYRSALMHGWMMVGAMHVTAGRLPEARQAFERATSSSVENRVALQSLATVQLQTGDGDQAVETLTKMVSASLRDIQLRLTLAQALVVTGRPEQAAQELDEAAAIGSGRSRAAVRAGVRLPSRQEGRGGRRLFAKVAAARPGAETYVLIGRTYRDFQQYDRARVALQRALKMNPRVRRAHYYLGTSAILEEGVVQLDEAIAEFQKELQITPDDPLATLRLGVVLVEARRNDEARPLLERSIKVPSPSYDAWLYLGRCQLALGDAADAVASLRRALDLAGRTAGSPGAPDVRRRSVHYQLAMALRATAGDGRSRHAVRRSAAPVGRAGGERARSAGAVHGRQRRRWRHPPRCRSASPASTRSARASAPSCSSGCRRRWRAPYLNLGIMQAQASRFESRRRAVRACRRLDPDFPQLQYSLGVAYFNAAQFAKALPALTRASEGQPQNADVRRMLAIASLERRRVRPGRGAAAEPIPRYRRIRRCNTPTGWRSSAAIAPTRPRRSSRGSSPSIPTSPSCNVVIGQIHAAHGDYDAAVAVAAPRARAARDRPRGERLARRHLHASGQAAGGGGGVCARSSPPIPATSRRGNTLAIVLDLDGKSDEALRELRTIVAARPNYADARYLFGKILLARGDRRRRPGAPRGRGPHRARRREHPLSARAGVSAAGPQPSSRARRSRATSG